MQKERDIAAAKRWWGSFNPNRAYTRSVEAHDQLAVQCRQNENLQQQNCSGEVSSQVGYAPVRLDAEGLTADQCRQSDSSQQQNSSRAVSYQFGPPVRVESQSQTAVLRRQSNSSQQQNSSRAVSNQIRPPVRFEVQDQTAAQRRQSDSSQQQNKSRAVSNQIGHAPVRLEVTATESSEVRVSDASHLIRPTEIQNSLGLANPAADRAVRLKKR